MVVKSGKGGYSSQHLFAFFFFWASPSSISSACHRALVQTLITGFSNGFTFPCFFSAHSASEFNPARWVPEQTVNWHPCTETTCWKIRGKLIPGTSGSSGKSFPFLDIVVGMQRCSWGRSNREGAHSSRAGHEVQENRGCKSLGWRWRGFAFMQGRT